MPTPPRRQAAAAAAGAALAALALWLAPGAAPAHADSTWTEHYRAAREAFAAGDAEAARRHFLRADALVGGSPNAMYNLAIVELRLRQPEAALAWLEEFAATGLFRDAGRDTLLAPLRGNARFARIVERIAANAAATGRAQRVVSLGDADLLPEDLAYDPSSRTFYVSSIHRRKIIAVDAAGRVRDFVPPAAWGMYALRLDPRRRRLWATTCATRASDAYVEADSGRAALVCFDSRDGRLLHRVELPRDGARHVLGDMTLGPDGTVYVTESVGGGVYALRWKRKAFETLAPPGTFGSPQSPVLAPRGRRLFVADYPRGIASLDLRARVVSWLPKPRTLGASGIDGLYLDGRRLIAVQNGWSVKRVLGLDLDASLERIVGWSVLEQATDALGEPSHGVVSGRDFFFLADTGWDRVDGEERLGTGGAARAPAILRLTLP